MNEGYAKLVIAVAGVVVLAIPFFYVSTPILAITTYVFSLPPVLFLRNLRHGNNQWMIRQYMTFAIICVALIASYCLHYLETVGYLGDSWDTWLEVVTSAGIFCFPPIYFKLILPPPNEEGTGRREERETERGTECRTVAVAFCYYASFIGCTVAAAAAAESLGLVAVESLIPYLLVASIFSLIFGVLLFSLPVLHTRLFSLLYFFITIPAALAAVGVLQATGSTILTKLKEVLISVRILVWVVILYHVLFPRAVKKAFN